MSSISDDYDYVVGVDTHTRTHQYAILAAATATVVAGPEKFAVTAAGFVKVIAWIARHTSGGRVLAAVEGTNSYGASLAAALTAAQIPLTEARPASKKARRGVGKTDSLDAVRAARSVLSLERGELTNPRQGAARADLQVLLIIRRQTTKEKTSKVNALNAIVRITGLLADTRAKLTMRQIRGIATGTLPVAGSPVTTGQAAALARDILDCQRALTANNTQLRTLVARWRPELLALPGVGPVTAAQILCAWSHPGRFASDAHFASLAGVSPVPIGSGNSLVYRLNYGGDRQLNSALHTIMLTRKRCDPRTQAYIAKRTADGKTPRAINRLLKRYIAREIYKLLEHPTTT
ncbi:IS110 family transposase, partial [Gordonia sp. TBRC 11910]